ncbi:MAG: diaminopimelate dehydrogenase [Gammaproteobacteria bacterium SG8_47]|nr:MAG: diaminopimelate dehydrogenase [Gammaproteobacteria bacterium SG8_47]
MTTLRLAVVGFGELGRACIQAIRADEHSELAGVVRRPEQVGEPRPTPFRDIAVAGHISELGRVDVALICVPTPHVVGVAHDLLQHNVSIVECAAVHGDEFQRHKDEIDRMAGRHKVPAVVGAGWDPGVLSLFRDLFALVVPHGHTDITRRPGVSLHHTTLAQTVDGVKGALSTELRASDGRQQHYIYVELETDTTLEEVERAIRADPLFLDEEVLVFAVDSIQALEDEGHGVQLERRGAAGPVEHQLLLLEGRFSERALAAQVMLAAARSIATRGRRAYSLFDLPLGSLWGELRPVAEEEWM